MRMMEVFDWQGAEDHRRCAAQRGSGLAGCREQHTAASKCNTKFRGEPAAKYASVSRSLLPPRAATLETCPNCASSAHVTTSTL